MDDPQDSLRKAWKELPWLSEQLISRPSVTDQHELIIVTVNRLTGGSANLWHAQTAYHLPGIDNLDFTASPISDAIKQVIETKKTYRLEAPIEKSPGWQIVAVPLITQDSLAGVLQVERASEHPFNQDEIDFLEALATHAAVSMQVTRQAAIENWRFEQLALVRSVSFQIANVLDLEELALRVTRLILHTFHFYYVAIYTTESDNNILRFRASARSLSNTDPDELKPQGFQVRLGEGMVGFVAETGQELVAADVKEEPHFRFIDSLPETQSEIALPLKVENKILGVLDVQSDHLDAFHAMDILVLKALADNIALAIEGAKLYSTAQKRAEQISTVVEVSRVITSILDFHPLLDGIVNLIQRRFGYPFVHLYSVNFEPRSIIFLAGSGARSEAMKAMNITYDLDDPIGIIPWVARSGTPILANDVIQDERYRPSLLSPAETSSELALPLIFGGKVLGVLDIQSNEKGVFNPDDLSLFEALAANVAISLRNATLYRSESWRRKVAESLRDVLGLISANVGLDQVLETILTELEQNLPCDVSGIWLFEEAAGDKGSNGSLHLAAVHGLDENALDELGEINPSNDAWVAQALQSDLPTIRTTNDPIGPFAKALGFSKEYSAIIAPLHANGTVLGLIALVHESEGLYGSESREMTATFASYAAVAIENTRIYAKAQEQAWISTVLLQVTEATQSLTSIDDLVSAIVRLTPLLVGVKGCAIFLWNESLDGFVMKAAYGENPAQLDKFSGSTIQPGSLPAFDHLLSTRTPILISNPAADLLIDESGNTTPGSTILVLLPMATRSELVGAFLITYDIESISPENNPTREEEQLGIIQGISQQTAVAIENIRLIEARQEEAYVTAVLLQVAQAVVGSNNLDDTLESIVNIMPILVGIDSCVIFLWDGEKKLFMPEYVYAGSTVIENELKAHSFRSGDFPILDMICQTDHPVYTFLEHPSVSILDWKKLPVPDSDLVVRQIPNNSAGLLMGFPLSAKGELFGTLFAEETSSRTTFREKRLEILSGIAQQASLAILNDRLQREMVGQERLEHEIQLARKIQQTFLPESVPDLPGWEMDVRWRTARQVGGDFYDYFELPGNQIGLVIADVSDKGMPAALYMAVTRTLIRATLPDYDSPAQVLERVNNLLLMNSQEGLFVTAFFAKLNLENGDLVYASAGHNLPLILRASSESVEKLMKGGPALGALGGEILLEDHHLQLTAGDFLILYTDGATEAFSPNGEIYGDDRLHSTIQEAHCSSAIGLLDVIESSITHFLQGQPPSDDMTLLVVHRSSIT
jgi:sigma-B regulation protein RsbU (phosphoserine phosphatase)